MEWISVSLSSRSFIVKFINASLVVQRVVPRSNLQIYDMLIKSQFMHFDIIIINGMWGNILNNLRLSEGDLQRSSWSKKVTVKLPDSDSDSNSTQKKKRVRKTLIYKQNLSLTLVVFPPAVLHQLKWVRFLSDPLHAKIVSVLKNNLLLSTKSYS